MADKKQIIEALKRCMDPEIRMDVWTLGLIKEKDISINKEKISIKMVPTTPYCPYLPQLIEVIKSEVKKIKGVKQVEVNVDLEAHWEPSEEVRMSLGI